MNPTSKLSHRKMARVAGVLYLVIFIVYPLSAFIGKENIVVAGDPTATVENIRTSESMFRIGIAGEAVIFLVEIIMAGILYELLKPVSTALSLAAAFSRLAEAVVQAVNLLPSILALILVSGAGYLAVFDAGQIECPGFIVYGIVRLHDHGLGILLRAASCLVGISGQEIGLFPWNPGHLVDIWGYWLPVAELWCLCSASTGCAACQRRVHFGSAFGTRIYALLADQRGKRSKV